MFTGIITDIGTLESVTQLDHGKRFRIATAYDPSTIDMGASIAHSGVCLTVTALGEDWYEVELWEEALRLSTLGNWQKGHRVNLERSLKIGDEIGGHLVSGHVDGLAQIMDVIDEGAARRFVLEAPGHLAKFIAQKGSVALDGTSLTVNKVEASRFDVLLISHSLSVTTWGERQQYDFVNLEIDQIARYAARLTEFNNQNQ